MPCFHERTNFFHTRLWKAVASFALFVACFSLRTRAADDPAKNLRTSFEAAKASLAAEDLVSAENHYVETITLGLRQMAQLSIAIGDIEKAAAYLQHALTLKPDDLETQVAECDVFFRKGEVSNAKAMLKSVIEKQPNNARARGLLGRIYVFEGDSDSAIVELKSSTALEGDFESGYFLGIAYLKSRKLDEASAWFQQLETKMGESAALHVLFGRAYLITKFSQQAIPEFTKALRLDPKYPRAHGFLGYAYLEYYQEEGYPRARDEFEKELKLYPDEYRVQELLGIADVNLRDFPRAETALLHAVRLNPREASLYLYLGETYAATNRTKAAVEALEKYVKVVGTPRGDKLREASRAHYLLGQNLRKLGREDEAKKAFLSSQQIREAKFKDDVQHIFDEKRNLKDEGESRVSDRVADLLGTGSALEQQGTLIQQGLPTPVPSKQPTAAKQIEGAKQYRAFVAEILGSSYNDLGVMRAKAGKFSEAAGFFREAAAWKPDLPGLDRNWGLASFRAELYSDATPPLERQLRAHPDDSFVRQLLGLSYSMLEKDANVVEVLRPFLEHPPEDPGLLLAWGTALVHTHQSAAAADIFHRLLEQNADNPSIHLLLGKAYAQQEEYPKALEEFRTALRLDPSVAEGHYYAGLVYLRQNEFDSAAGEFRSELDVRPGNPHAIYHLGYTLLLKGDLPNSVPLLREAVRAMPENEIAHFELGRALLQQGDAVGAITDLETASKLAPDHDAAYFQLSQAYRRAGRMQEAGQALAVYQRLIESNRQKKRETLEIEKP